MARIAFKTYTLSDSSWTTVTAPNICSYYFIHVIGAQKPAYIMSSKTDDSTFQDVVESGWTAQIPFWSGPGPRWNLGDIMFFLQASSGNNGMQVGITFVF